jgi:hypothetical protein
LRGRHIADHGEKQGENERGRDERHVERARAREIRHVSAQTENLMENCKRARRRDDKVGKGERLGRRPSSINQRPSKSKTQERERGREGEGGGGSIRERVCVCLREREIDGAKERF